MVLPADRSHMVTEVMQRFETEVLEPMMLKLKNFVWVETDGTAAKILNNFASNHRQYHRLVTSNVNVVRQITALRSEVAELNLQVDVLPVDSSWTLVGIEPAARGGKLILEPLCCLAHMSRRM